MTEATQWAPAYILTTTPADDAGNFYIPGLIPAGDYKLPAGVIRQGPTTEQLAAGKPLKYDHMAQLYVESGEDPNARMIAELGKQLVTTKADAKAKQDASDKLVASLGLQVVNLTKQLKAATATGDTTPADDAAATDADKTTEEAK